MGYFDTVKTKPRAAPDPAPSNVTAIRRADREGLHPYARAVVEGELARLDACHHAPEGHAPRWDDTTYEVACNLIEIANSPWSGYSIDQAHRDLRDRAPRDSHFDDRRIEQKWASAEGKVGGTGRSEPEKDTPLPALTTIDAQPEAATEDVGPPLNPIIDWHELFASTGEEEEWILEPLLPARRMIALYSAPKAGKSLLMLEIAAGIAGGKEVIGAKPDQAHRVLYVDFENDPRGDVLARLEAMDVTPDQLTNLCYLTFPSLAKFDTAQGAIDLMRHVEHYDCDVVVIDTVSRAVAGEENENDTWLAFYRHTGLALKRAGIACIRLDHSGKDKEKGMRGGSAKYGDVDAVWRLTAINEDTVQIECTDHRMPVPTLSLTLTRQEFPLVHRIASDGYQAAADAKTRRVDERLDSLNVPCSASVREATKALRVAGERFENAAIRAAVKLRKLRLDLPSTGVPGTPPAHPGTPGVSVPGTPPAHPGTPGVSVPGADPYVVGPPAHPSGRAETARHTPPEGAANDPDQLVGCKTCFGPATEAVARKNGGACATCAVTNPRPDHDPRRQKAHGADETVTEEDEG